MKKLLIFVFAFTLFYLVSVHAVFSQNTTIVPQQSEEATKSADKIAKAEYNLPYPGILPDNPLYFLKALRDRLIGILVSDPLKKAEFNLLTSDKRMAASEILANKGKNKLALDALSKSNNYFHNAISSADAAKKGGKNIDIVLHNLENSIIKHQEVLVMIQKKLGDQFSSELATESQRMGELKKSVSGLRL